MPRDLPSFRDLKAHNTTDRFIRGGQTEGVNLFAKPLDSARTAQTGRQNRLRVNNLLASHSGAPFGRKDYPLDSDKAPIYGFNLT